MTFRGDSRINTFLTGRYPKLSVGRKLCKSETFHVPEFLSDALTVPLALISGRTLGSSQRERHQIDLMGDSPAPFFAVMECCLCCFDRRMTPHGEKQVHFGLTPIELQRGTLRVRVVSPGQFFAQTG